MFCWVYPRCTPRTGREFWRNIPGSGPSVRASRARLSKLCAGTCAQNLAEETVSSRGHEKDECTPAGSMEPNHPSSFRHLHCWGPLLEFHYVPCYSAGEKETPPSTPLAGWGGQKMTKAEAVRGLGPKKNLKARLEFPHVPPN